MPRPCGCGLRGRHRSTCPLSKRPRSETDDEHEQVVNLASSLKKVADQFVCPITQELLVDPVLAEDGKFYERNAILKWFSDLKCRNVSITSPCTRATISEFLLPAISVKNSLEILINSGAIDSNVSAVWKKKMKIHKFLGDLRAKTENNDLDSVAYLGKIYECGLFGLPRDLDQAICLYDHGIELGDARSMMWRARLILLRPVPNPNEGTFGSISLAMHYFQKALNAKSGIAAMCLCELYDHFRPRQSLIGNCNREQKEFISTACHLLETSCIVDARDEDDYGWQRNRNTIMEGMYAFDKMPLNEVEMDNAHKETLEKLIFSGEFSKYENFWAKKRAQYIQVRMQVQEQNQYQYQEQSNNTEGVPTAQNQSETRLFFE